LLQVDLDGKNNYSQIVDVYFGNETLVNMYPNPVQNQLTVEVNTPKATAAELRIMDATGRVVRTVVMNLSEGLNETEVSMEGLADGVYLLRLSNDKGLNYSQMIRKN
jgi:predicted carbohydrate-binding protein with CBM5 and CBM33 domain